VLLASNYEYPGRYTRWDMGFVDPPLALIASGRAFRVEALNARGRVLLRPIRGATRLPAVENLLTTRMISRARRASLRPVRRGGPQPAAVGLLGPPRASSASSSIATSRTWVSTGPSATSWPSQFEPIRLRLPRRPDQRDLVLYLPDELIIVDHRRDVALRRRYDFEGGRGLHRRIARTGAAEPYVAGARTPRPSDHAPGEYAAMVRVARQSFQRGDLFEVVPGQTFHEAVSGAAAELFRRLRESNPAVRLLMNLGEAGISSAPRPRCTCASRATAWETCPISGRSPGAATRSATPPRSWPCSARPRTRPS